MTRKVLETALKKNKMAWLSCTNSCKKVFVSVCYLSARFQDITFWVAEIEVRKNRCFEGKHKDFKPRHHDAWHCNQETSLDTHFQRDFFFVLYGSLRRKWKMFLTDKMSWLVEEMCFTWFVIANMIQVPAWDEFLK